MPSRTSARAEATPAHRLIPVFACLTVVALVAVLSAGARADELFFDGPAFLPGDDAFGPSAGMQEDADIAAGDGISLAVWVDYRSSPDDYPPFATEGTGGDVYGAILGADGAMLPGSPFVIDQSPGDQVWPRVAWNGQHWLVVWKQETTALPTYEKLMAARVAPDGTVVDTAPIGVADAQAYYRGLRVGAGAGQWVVLYQADAPTGGLHATRVDAAGTVLDPAGALIHPTDFLLDFDLAYAQDMFMIVWSGSFDTPRGRRYTPDLQEIGTTTLPFAHAVASSGNDFMVSYASGQPPLATVESIFVGLSGGVFSPLTLYTAGGQSGTCCADVTHAGNHYWVSWGGPTLARVDAFGRILDEDGIAATSAFAPISQPAYAGLAGGGVQMVYNHGVSGAAYPKDVHTAQVPGPAGLTDESTISVGAPAQLAADLAEGEGVHLAVYLSRSSGEGRILAHRLDSQGAPLDPEPIEVASGPIPGIGLPSLGEPGAAWNGSVFMVTWSDGLQILARRLNPDGSFVDATPLVVMDGHDPDVAAVGPIFLVVGLDFLSDNPHWQATHSMRVDGATGQNLDLDPNALGGFVIFARHPRVVSWGDRWLVVWQQNLSHDNTIAGTTAAIVHQDGTTPGIIDVPLGWRPAVAVAPDRALFVAVTNTIASATTDLAGIVMLADGSFPNPWFLISDAPEKQLRPAAAWNGEDFVVAWEDKRNATIYFDEEADIYGARVSGAGEVLDPDGVALAVTAQPEIQPALLAGDGATLLGVSTFRPEPDALAYRLGLHVDAGITTAVEDRPVAAALPAVDVLGARPNPANPATNLRFALGDEGPVTVRLYGADGRLVRTLVDGRVLAAGEVSLRWDGRDDAGRPVRSGVYLYEVRTARAAAGGKVVILK